MLFFWVSPRQPGWAGAGRAPDDARVAQSDLMLEACRPLGPCLVSNSTLAPSASERKPPLFLISLWWAKRSLPPPSGVMKPKPLPSSNHFTVPVSIVMVFPLKVGMDENSASDMPCGDRNTQEHSPGVAEA